VQTNDKDLLTVVIGTDYFEITNTLGTREEFLTVKRYLDGRHSLGAIATATGVPLRSITEIVEAFSDLGMLRTSEPESAIPIERFLRQIHATTQMWGRQLGYHRLYAGLERTEWRKEVFLGLLIETFHYVHAASSHIACAVAHSRRDAWTRLLGKYFIDEHDHGHLIAETLLKLGIPQRHLYEAQPLIGTTSLIQMLREIGRQNTLGYIACTALFEARREGFTEAQVAFERLAESYGFGRDTVAPIISHMTGDIEAGHKSLLEEAMAEMSHIAAPEAHYIVNQLHDLKHGFDQFHDQIIQYYTDISNFIPRRRVDFFSL
jgi:hypothetical protein